MPALPGTLHNWKTAEPYIAATNVPWLKDKLDQIRVSAYGFYDSVYQNAPETWKVLMYDAGRRPIYVPSAKILINALNRYIAPGMDVIVDPDWLALSGMELPADQPDPALAIRQLFQRTSFYAKFASEKRMGRVRGDWLFMLQGDLENPEGTRLNIVTVDPAAYWPIFSEVDSDVIIGCHIVEEWRIPGSDDTTIRRITFRKTFPSEEITSGPGTITVEEAIFAIDEWGGPGMEEGSPIEVISPPTELDPRITDIPVYHIRSNYRNGEDFGTSDIAGMESMMVSLNQNSTDEDLSLALVGLGTYWTSAGAPIDPDTGEELPWQIGPMRVVEVPTDRNFGRVPGITSIEPYQDHINFLRSAEAESMGITSIALGNVAVDEAESGIALALKLAPTLATAEEEELQITTVMRRMLNDLKAWLQVYEGINLGETVFTVKYRSKVPENRKQKFDELLQLFNANLVSGSYVRAQLRALGYDMPDDATMLAEIIAEKQAMQQIVSDVTGSRLDTELAGVNGNGSQ